MSTSAFDAIVPMVCVALAGLFALLAEAFRGKGEQMPIGGLAVIGLVGAGVASVLLWDRNASSFGVVTADNFALFVNLVLVVVGLLTVIFSSETIERDGLPAGEYYALILFAIVGMMLMAQSSDLLVMFLALEIMSLAVYVLTGHPTRPGQRAPRRPSSTSCSAPSPARSSSTASRSSTASPAPPTSNGPAAAIAAQSMADSPMLLIAIGLLLVGFAFKVAAVPFHMWTPDAYEGAPTVVTGFMSTGVKAAAFAAFVRVFLSALEPLVDDWTPVLWALAVADDGRRHRGRRRADQRQADARLLEHRARRLPAGRPSSPPTTSARRRCSSTWRPTR